jgi:fumarate reductase subunit C
MIRLIGFFIVFALFLVFIVLNLDNKCDVNLGFITFTEAPVYITAFISLFIGMICTLPVIFSLKKKGDSSLGFPGSRKKNKGPATTQDNIPGENGPYGID